MKEAVTRFRLFLTGWRRRSALMMDAAGIRCPQWLIRLRCPIVVGWGAILDALLDDEVDE